MKFYILFIVLFFLSAPATAKDNKSWLTPIIGDHYGVQIKEGRTSDKELQQIKEAGFGYVRFVIPWYEVERGRGLFVWSSFDSIIYRLREYGLRAVIVLGAGHPLYTKRIPAPEGNIDQTDFYLAAPHDEEEIEAFARYAKETVQHFGGDDIIWEIWNEPDSDRFWSPKADVEDYIKVAIAACTAIRNEQPKAHIIGPGMADTPGRFGHLIPGFLGKVLQSPASSCFDAISLHPYRDGIKPPETVLKAYDQLRAYIKAFTPKEQTPHPVLSTEWGFTLTDTNEEDQAAFLLRSLLLNSLSEIPISIWYEWRDEREGEDDPEAHFGLLTLDQKPKKSYEAARSFLPELKGGRIEQRLPLGGPEDFVLLIRKPDGTRRLVFWSTQTGPQQLILAPRTNGPELGYTITPMPQILFYDPNLSTPQRIEKSDAL